MEATSLRPDWSSGIRVIVFVALISAEVVRRQTARCRQPRTRSLQRPPNDRFWDAGATGVRRSSAGRFGVPSHNAHLPERRQKTSACPTLGYFAGVEAFDRDPGPLHHSSGCRDTGVISQVRAVHRRAGGDALTVGDLLEKRIVTHSSAGIHLGHHLL